MKLIIDIPEWHYNQIYKGYQVNGTYFNLIWDCIAKGVPLKECEDWIPVSKRLPEEDGVYLVTLEYVEDSEIVNEIDMAKFVYSEKDDCNDGFHKAYTVIAWRPLPEVYMEGL